MFNHKPIIFLFYLLIGSPLFAQNFYLPVNELSLLRMERAGLHRESGVHFGFKPISTKGVNFSSVEGVGADSTDYYYWITAKLFGEHLLELDKKGLAVNADFIFDFGYGGEVEATDRERVNTFINTRGFAISGQIGDKVYFYTDFRENQARFPSYLTDFIDSTDVVPGNGRIKPFNEDGYDFNMASGFVGIRATDWLDVNFGHYKQFIGHGHRSLLLSDNSFNYPYASYEIKLFDGKLAYRNSLAILQNLERLPAGDAPESLFKRKMMSLNYLSYKPVKQLEIGLFESIVWKRFDDSTGTRPFNFNALNPVPFINTAIRGLGDPTANALLGLNLAVHPTKSLSFYGQAMLDNIGGESDKFGYQVGGVFRNLLNRMDVRAEYNTVSQMAYSNPDPLQSYTHFGQPLAHPYGAGFEEYYVSLKYFHDRILADLTLVWAKYDRTGRDPLAPTDSELVYPAGSLGYQDFKFAYVFNPRTNMQVYAGITNRNRKADSSEFQNQFWYFGIRTNLANSYRDF